MLISDSVDGSPISYTVGFFDAAGLRCSRSSTLNASLCGGGNICSQYFSIANSLCTTTEITVFATNVLGDGLNYTKDIGSWCTK